MVAIPTPPVNVADVVDAKLCAQQPSSNRRHLGCSIIGRKCSRQIYYSFRWFSDTKHPGRLLRLFARGHREEASAWEYLQLAGCEMVPGSDVWRFEDYLGHLGGETDGIIHAGLPEAPKTPHLLEVKTHSKSSFERLQSVGVLKAKPEHYNQMQLYMGYANQTLTRALYWSVCKDNDKLHTERIHFDKELFESLKTKAQQIIFTDTIPAPIDPERKDGECYFCDHKSVCKGEQAPAINCRTCIHSVPTKDKTWTCNHHGEVIPHSVDVDGCPSYEVISNKQ